MFKVVFFLYRRADQSAEDFVVEPAGSLQVVRADGDVSEHGHDSFPFLGVVSEKRRIAYRGARQKAAMISRAAFLDEFFSGLN